MTNLLCHHISCTKLTCGKSNFQRPERSSRLLLFYTFQCLHQAVWLPRFGSHHLLPYHLSGRFVSQYVLNYPFLSYCHLLCQNQPLNSSSQRSRHSPSTFLYRAAQSDSCLTSSLLRDNLCRMVEWHKSQAPFCRLTPCACLANPEVRSANLSCGPLAGSCLTLSQD